MVALFLPLRPAVRQLGQRAFISFLRSVRLSRDKDIFNIEKLLEVAPNTDTSKVADEYAHSLGLGITPSLSDVIDRSSKKQKKMSKLERLKQKILEKRAKKTEVGNKEQVDDWIIESENDSEKKRRMSKKEKRLERLRQLREESQKGIKIANDAKEDDQSDAEVLERVDGVNYNSEENGQILLVDMNSSDTKKKLLKQKIKFRADGTAKVKGLAALRRDEKAHVFFNSDDEGSQTG